MASPVVLQVAVHHARDVAGAVEGGADRLQLAGPEGRAPSAADVSAVCHESDVPVFVRLGEDGTRAEELLAAGAAGLDVGFLDADLEIDTRSYEDLAARLPEIHWTWHGIDDTLEPRRSWRRLATLPRLVGACSAGSPRGMSEGYDDLLATVGASPAVAPLVIAGDGLLAEHVPWLLRAGVRQFHLGAQARPGGSDRAYVDSGHVRSWRRLLDQPPGGRA